MVRGKEYFSPIYSITHILHACSLQGELYTHGMCHIHTPTHGCSFIFTDNHTVVFIQPDRI